MSGKGSARRPLKADEKTFADNWARIFGRGPREYSVTVPEPLGSSTAASATGSNPADLGSSPSSPAIYIDNATGNQVSKDWWPGDPLKE